MPKKSTGLDGPVDRCFTCGGTGSKTVQKQQKSTHYVNDIATGKREKVETYTTVEVVENCKACKGTGIK